jgi:HAD superfamily hydrolase (TIGR01509 family)
MKYSTLIFDLDGTLVDSKIDFPTIYQKLGLKPGLSIIEYINGLTSEDDRRAALDIVHYYENQGAENSTLIPGVIDLLDELSVRKVNVGVFTLNSRAIALKSLQLHKIEIPLLISREDAKPKPDPEGLFKICEHYGASIDQALYVGDYKYDLIAGKNANIKTALYLSSEANFNTEDAYMQFANYSQLADYLFQSKN